MIEREYDFEITRSDGSILKGAFNEGGTVGLYDERNELAFVGPADYEWIKRFGTVKAGMLVIARLELDEGLSEWS